MLRYKILSQLQKYTQIYTNFRIHVPLINLNFLMECYVTKYYHNYRSIPKITLLVSTSCSVSDFDESVMYRHPKCSEQQLQIVLKREI